MLRATVRTRTTFGMPALIRVFGSLSVRQELLIRVITDVGHVLLNVRLVITVCMTSAEFV